MRTNLKRILLQAIAGVMGYSIALSAMVLPATVGAQGAPRPSCYATVNGEHVMVPRIIWGEHARHIFWACSPRGGQPEIYGFSCRNGHCIEAALLDAQNAILKATAKVRTADEMWQKYVTVDCGSPQILAAATPDGDMCRERRSLIDAFGPGWLK